MNVFSEQAKQQVLENLFALATECKSTNVSAIKLYLDLADEQTPSESLTTEQAIELLRLQAKQAAPPVSPHSCQQEWGDQRGAGGSTSQAFPEQGLQTSIRLPEQGLQTSLRFPEQGLQHVLEGTLPELKKPCRNLRDLK